jgi:hypothetical protein
MDKFQPEEHMLQVFEWGESGKNGKSDFFTHKSHEKLTWSGSCYKQKIRILTQETAQAKQLLNGQIPTSRAYVTGI